ncbi:MAG: hypothetical protein U1F15_04450 [Burkholderiales bacterium]
MIFGENAMQIANRQLDLALVRPSPWMDSRAMSMLASRLSWRRIARDACLLFGLALFAVMVVALRLALNGQSVVPQGWALLATVVTAITAVLLLVGAQRLDPPAKQPAR